jgi:hypothetical protein
MRAVVKKREVLPADVEETYAKFANIEESVATYWHVVRTTEGDAIADVPFRVQRLASPRR